MSGENLRGLASDLFMAAVKRADPSAAVRGQLDVPELAEGGRHIVIAIGKAAVPMMRAALDEVPEPRQALVVTNPENICDLPGATVIAGAHPVPDENSFAAGRAVIDLLQSAGPADRVTALISGGGSALAIAPAEGLSLDDKAAVNAILLGAGIEINEMNLVRQQLSALKGGGFLRHAAPAPVAAYMLSDVIGDDLRAIASGPTVAPISDRAGAKALLMRYGVWDQLPSAVQLHLSSDKAGADDAQVSGTNTLVGSNRLSLDAMLAAVPGGWAGAIVSDALIGDVADAAEQILATGAAAEPGPRALIFGGETTVRLQGDGLGGRNQELAMRVAMGAAGHLRDGWVFLSGGTDGRDGPTEAAGGTVDGDTLTRITAAGADADALLANNDSNAALNAAGDLLIVGGTGTNVADVQVLLLP